MTKKPKIVPNSSEEDSNTNLQNKQVSPAKYWCFTLNNYDSSNISNIIEICNKNKIDYIFGEEVGLNKTPHLQGFIRYSTKNRPFNIFENKSIHWEKSKSNFENNVNYCKKQGTYYTNLKIPEDVKIYNEILPRFECVMDIINNPIDERNIHWFYGEQNIGKTQFLKYLYVKHNAFIVSGTSKCMKNAIIEYMEENNKCLPKLLISNLPFETDMNNISYNGYEEIKDMFFYSGKYHGGMVCGNNPHLIIFANNEPNTMNSKFIVKKL